MARMNIDKNNYDDEETLCSEKVRDELIQLFISSKMLLIDDCLKLSVFQRKCNNSFWLKGGVNNSKVAKELENMKNEGLIDWAEKDVKSPACLIKFTEKGKLIFFG